jgi:hypothetical protein
MLPLTSAVVWSIYSLLCASAWIPLEARSNNEVDLGTLSSMKEFLTKMGFDANSTWEEITDYETTNLDATLESFSPRTSPASVFLAERADTCEDLTGFSKILCDNMPDRAAWWAAGGVLAIWYFPDYLVKWCDAIAHVIVTARSLRQMRDGSDLNRGELSGPGIGGGPRDQKRGDPNTNYKILIPAIVNGVPVEKRSDEG